MSVNIAKIFLLVISFVGGTFVAAERKQVDKVRKISDAVAIPSAGPSISFCENPGKHTAMVENKPGYTMKVEGPFPTPKEKADMWTVFITMSNDERIFSNNFTKAIHSVEWKAVQKGDALRVTFCDGNFCFLRLK